LRGKEQGILYSLSRWTDVPAAKWPWLKQVLERGEMIGVDPRTGVPVWWSLTPEDTLGLVFWTKDPTNLLADRDLLRDHQVKVHVTLTGWEEVEKGAPDIRSGIRLLQETVECYGAENVTWRFSPVPILPGPELYSRFRRIAEGAQAAGLGSVFISFLQTNDRMAEPRDSEERSTVLADLQAHTSLDVILCAEDSTPVMESSDVRRGICAPPLSGMGLDALTEGCGCVLMADPFTINESCTLGCEYCYAADKSLSTKKRNTTRRSLEIVQ